MKVPRKKLVAIVGGVVLVAGAFLSGVFYASNKAMTPRVYAEVSTPVDVPVDWRQGFAAVAESVKRSVVYIKTERVIKYYMPFYNDPFFRHFFGDFFGEVPPQQRKQSGVGSGFVIDGNGHILTNNHVVAKSDKIIVRFFDGVEVPASIVGTDPKTDVAVIKIDKRKLPNKYKLYPVRIGDSDKIRVGDWAIAVGNPFGLENTVTVGVISAKGRSDIGVAEIEDFIQTDASINPGNSGGPLLNIKGEVIGMNTAIVVSGQGIGFAVPINMAMEIYHQLLKKGKIVRGYLGVYIQDVNQPLAKEFGLPEPHGVIVLKVVPGSPADKAGIREDDIIVEYNGKKVKGARHLKKMVAMTEPGKWVDIKIFRDGKYRTLKVKITELPTEALATAEESPLGIEVKSVKDLSPAELQKYDVREKKGVVVIGVKDNSPLAQYVRVGDVILKINRTRIETLEDYIKAVSKIKKGDTVIIQISRGGYRVYLTVTL